MCDGAKTQSSPAPNMGEYLNKRDEYLKKSDMDRDGRPMASGDMIRRVGTSLHTIHQLYNSIYRPHEPRSIGASAALDIAFNAGREQAIREIFSTFGFQLPR